MPGIVHVSGPLGCSWTQLCPTVGSVNVDVTTTHDLDVFDTHKLKMLSETPAMHIHPLAYTKDVVNETR
jgi:hypothetical protein